MPALIAECLSPRDRKGPLADLLEDYRRLRAPEVWIIDPHMRRAEIHYFASPVNEPTIIRDGSLSSSELPEVIVELQSLWDAFDGEW